MFDPVSFCLVIAQQVLGSLIVDFIEGKRKSASKRDLESMIHQIMDGRLREAPPVELARLRGHVLNEIHGLADQDPDLEYGRFQSLRPTPDLLKADDPVQRRNELLVARMQRLDALVTQRRRSLGLPVVGAGVGPRTDAVARTPVEIETVEIPDNGEYWSRRMRETQHKISDARRKPIDPADRAE